MSSSFHNKPKFASVSNLKKGVLNTTNAFTIKVKLGTKVSNLTVDETKPLSSFALSFALKFTAEQRLFLKVNGLKLVVEDGGDAIKDAEADVISMVEDKQIHHMNDGPTIVELKDLKRLIKGATYELIISDKREEYSNQLSEEELAEIKGHFNSMDLDQNGVLTTDEVVEYHRKEMEKNIEMTKKITDRKILLDPIRKEKYMSDFNARQSFYRNMLDQNVKFFMQIDSDASGSISWQEFLAHAARQKIRERNQGDREKDINNDIARELEKERARTQRASKLKRLNKY